MKCPRCSTVLSEIARSEVLVDVCDQCLGMWLDRGELEKISLRIQKMEEDLDRGDVAPHASLKERWRKMSSIFVE